MKVQNGTPWLLNGNVSLSARHCPTWPAGFRLFFHENGGRRRNECLDLNLNVGKWALSLTFWGMRGLPLLIGWIPSGPRGRGFHFGRMPAVDWLEG